MRSGADPANDACVVRLANTGDEDFLQQVLDEASGTRSALIHGDDPRTLLRTHTVFIGFVDGRAVGCVMASEDPERALIHNLAVAKSYRQQGHATTLVKSAMTQLDADGPRDYWTAADPANPSAIKRFHRLGFSTFDDGSARDVILMMRPAVRPTSETDNRHATTHVPTAITTIANNRRTAPPAPASNDPA